jgi:alpha-tubulin suppressor-like RCC1 family protein
MTFLTNNQYLNNRYLSNSGFSINNTLWSWGNNSIGQLGLSDTTNRSSPVQIGPPATWTNIANGGNYNTGFTIGIQSNGSLWAVGYDGYGQLGINSLTNYSSPVQVGNLYNWTQISCGNAYVLALQSPGTLWAWGQGQYGVLGTSNQVNYSSPIQVGALSTWTQISAGYNYSYGIRSDNTLWAWGLNLNGQLGQGNTSLAYYSPVQVGALSTWTQVNAGGGNFVLALQSDGTMYSWGSPTHGQLGNNTTSGNVSTPIQIGVGSTWKTISAGQAHAGAIQSNGTLWMWGYNVYGQLGFNSGAADVSTPVQIGALSNWASLTCAKFGYATFATKTDGTLWAWGQNLYGQLGQGNTTNYSSPLQIGTLTSWSRLACGYASLLAIQSPGSLYAVGLNSNGQFGNNKTLSTSSPVQVLYYTAFTQVSCGYNYYSLGIQSPGTLWSWGSNSFGQLGVNTSGTNNTSSPVQIPYPIPLWANINGGGSGLAIATDGTLWGAGANNSNVLGPGYYSIYTSPTQIYSSYTSWTQVSGAAQYALGIQSPGTLWAWGSNVFGNLGLGDLTQRSSLVQVGALTNWTAVSTGYYHVLAIQSPGTLWAWGTNTAGQFGNNSTGDSSSPIQIGTISYWTQVCAGVNNSIGIQSNGTLWAWGSNYWGMLGLNTTTLAYSSPVQVGALSIWSKATIGYSSAFAIQSNGTLWAWGVNAFGELGLNTSTTYNSSPAQVGTTSNWAQVSSPNNGSTFTAAIQSNGTLWTWGTNSYGQLGLAQPLNFTTSSPIQVGTQTNWKNVSVCFSGTYNAYVWATQNTGILFTWGNNSAYQLANNSLYSQSSPIQIGQYPSNWTQIAAGNSHWLGITSNGNLWSCGYNNNGQLGNNNTSNLSVVGQVGLLNSWTQVAAGNFSSYARQNNSTLWSWGFNNYGQLGTGNTNNASTPVQVGALSNWTNISVNSTSASAIALQSNGSLWSWGLNNYGQLGNSNTNNYSSPIQVGALTVWTQIAEGGFSGYAIQSNGTLWSWGNNSSGQLGLNDQTHRSSPVQIGTNSNWIQVGAGALQLIAIQNNGTLWMCGYNAQGQLGNNSTTNISSLVQVGSLNKWNFATGARHILAQQAP